MPDPRGTHEADSDLPVRELLDDSAEDLYEHAPCGYLSTLLDGTVARVNRTFLRWTGYRSEDLVGRRRFQELLSAGGRIFHETHYAPLLRMQGSVREVAVDIVRADGSRLPALVNSTLKTDAAGRPVLVRTTVFDATERREYERELLRERQRAEESEGRARVLAQTLQASLMPPAAPAVPGLDIAAVYRPAGAGDEVGGDFYDVFELPHADWAVVIGDVCGKGAAAASVTALARYTIRAAVMRIAEPRRILALLNEALLRQDVDRFCTVMFARVSTADGRATVTLSSGGHPLPLRIARSDGVSSVGQGGDLLGVMEDVTLHDTAIELHAAESLVLFTDGVIEARRGRAFFGEERLTALLEAHKDADASGLANLILQEVLAFQNGVARDDIAVVVLRVPNEGKQN